MDITIIYDQLLKILSDEAAKDIIRILVNHFNYYITSEEIQKLNIVL